MNRSERNEFKMDADLSEDTSALFWDIQGSADYIVSRKYTIVTLQFPDDLLKEATRVSRALQDACAAKGMLVKAFVLADTTYNSLGVDEVAAQHVHAHCVIHYGRASMSPLSSLPAYFVFTRAPLDCHKTAEKLAAWAASTAVCRSAVIVLPDQPLAWAVEELRRCVASAAHEAGLQTPFIVAGVAARQLDPASSIWSQAAEHASAKCSQTAEGSSACSEPSNWAAGGSLCCRDAQLLNVVPDLSEIQTPSEVQKDAPAMAALEACCRTEPSGKSQREDHSAEEEDRGGGHMSTAGLEWDLPKGVHAEDCTWMWLGDDGAPALTELLMTYSRMPWAIFNPQEDSIREGSPLDISRTLRKRRYLVEKAKNASIVGIVVGTLGVAGYLEASEKVRELAQAAGKKTYTLLMGKPSPVKLANFPEVDVFVLIADAQGQIMDSKEFYAPLITPYEAQLAFGAKGADVSDDYRLDFDVMLGTAPQASTSGEEDAPRFSLIDGGHHGGPSGSPTAAASRALAKHASQVLRIHEGPGMLAEVKSAAQYLVSRRTYRGLETPYTGAEAKPVIKAVPGRSGRAAQYEDEPVA